MDPKKKFFLFKKSQHFCSVPWNYLKIDTDGVVKTCVKGKTILGNINNNSIEEILKNPELKKIRESLYNDQPTENCSLCRELDNPEKSYSFLRDMYNDWFKTSNVDYSDFDTFHLSGIDLHWSSICNIKCITCWPKQSSAIAKELNIPILSVSKNRSQEIIDWVVSHQHQLKEIYFSGGEPTLIKHNIRLLEKLDPRPDLLLRVNTNMTFDRQNPFMKEISRFTNVLVTMSADALGERFEYIRQGADWQVFLDNVKWMKDLNYQLRINSVFFVASAQTLMETQQFFKNQFDIDDFTINQCGMDKNDLLCRNLPDKTKIPIIDDLENNLKLPGMRKNFYGQIFNCLAEIKKDPNELDYKKFFDDIDQRRGTDWKKIFKELL